jgi:RNA polymerase sigma-70 factor (ECF subfamily)
MHHEQPFTSDVLAKLVAEAQDGDTESFGKIYDGFFLPVYRYTIFRFPQELAEDLVADIFVKAWEKLHTYKAHKGVPFSAWLFRIARHTVIDAYRRTRGFEEIPDDLADVDTWNDPKHRADHAIILKTVRKAMNELPRRYRDILLLSYVSDLSHQEVARSMRMTEGGVRILKFRALKKLEKLLPKGISDHA